MKLKEIHADGVASIQARADHNQGMILRSNRVLWGPKNTQGRNIELALSTADVAFIIWKAVSIYGGDAVVQAVMKAEQSGQYGPMPTTELEGGA